MLQSTTIRFGAPKVIEKHQQLSIVGMPFRWSVARNTDNIVLCACPPGANDEVSKLSNRYIPIHNFLFIIVKVGLEGTLVAGVQSSRMWLGDLSWMLSNLVVVWVENVKKVRVGSLSDKQWECMYLLWCWRRNIIKQGEYTITYSSDEGRVERWPSTNKKLTINN